MRKMRFISAVNLLHDWPQATAAIHSFSPISGDRVQIAFDCVSDATLVEQHLVPDGHGHSSDDLVTSKLLDHFAGKLTRKTAPDDTVEAEKRALKMFEQAMYISQYQRLPIAVSVVAFFYEFGLAGMEEPDYASAERMYNLAATMNCTFAQARLGFLKMHGRPNIKINQAAGEEYRTALAQKSKLRSRMPGLPSTSLSWLHILAENNHPAAQFCLGLCFYNGIAVTKCNSIAYKWCHSAAIQGHPGAMNMLGNLYTEGDGTIKLPSLGLRWYIRAAELKDAAAIYNIGTLFERGIAVEEDARQAYEWYVRASVFGSINAQNVLGIFYEQGIGVVRNPLKAVQYYKVAAGNGHPHAIYNLARCYHDGFGVSRDDTVALMWFKMASAQGHVLSMLSTAICFDSGIGMFGKRNGKFARFHYWNAAAKGNREAKKRLKESVALEMLVAARPLLAGRIQTQEQREQGKMINYEKRTTFQPSRSMPARWDIPQYDDATEEILARLGLNSHPSRLRSNYYNKALDEIMSPTTSDILKAEMARFHRLQDIRTDIDTDEEDEVFESFSSFSGSSGVKRGTSIQSLPTEILLHILSFLNGNSVLTEHEVSRVLKVSSDRTNLLERNSKEDFLTLVGLTRVAIWVDDEFWCQSCGMHCDKIKHHMIRKSLLILVL
ncbi:hypothetical protein HDU84_006662 [Entophlyctis sp. JEL0112]|nr:hypothetical protein HDU84_006662 [Entophlyctis sp. JEL0112]